MITIFSIPKPFAGHIGIIQRNALESWTRLGSVCEVILFGDDEGVAEAADEFGVRYVSEVAKNEYGTPLLDSVFEKAQELAKHDKMCYVNGDIILLSDIVKATCEIKFDKFLMVGQRWDVDIDKLLDHKSSDWEKELRVFVKAHGQLHPPTGSDYFIFPKGALGKLPPFAVGRPGWDTWVIYRGRKLGIPVIDGSSSATVIHQNHDYGHVSGGDGKSWKGPEGDTNIDIMGGWDYVFTLRDTNWVHIDGRVIRRQWNRSRIVRFIGTLPVLHPYLRPVAKSLLKIAKQLKYKIVHFKIKMSARRSPLKVIVGASGVYQNGWVPTDVDHVNLLDEGSWRTYFAEDSIAAIMAEHVWEHLNEKDAVTAAESCFKYLKSNGYIRVAVPDGFHPSKEYIDAVKPGGSGAGSDDHRVLYNYKTLSEIFETAGFRVELLEWFDENGQFNFRNWDEGDGKILRSKRDDKRNEGGQLNYTSIILDATKR